MSHHRITFITPLFSKGSYDNRPEIRPPSIRGQLHWWFRALGGSHADEKAIFGGVHGDPVASKIVVRVGGITGQTGEVNTLPHKRGGQASPKWAYKPDASFDLIITERLGGLTPDLRAVFQRTLEAWLLLGTLGLRSTRAGGSFNWEPKSDTTFTLPVTFDDYATRIRDLLKDAPLKAALLPKSFTSAEEARKIVSDTLGGRNDHQGENDLAGLNYPLGRVFGGRKTSPLRFRIVKIDGKCHIAAIWDDRSQVTGNLPADLQGIIDLLASRGKRIGSLMNGHI